ncbi:unnamed protein product [Owenia fusiformis]|uniref:Uncharacterized protein n=1 Tax=Owenia fusiformis TaxID=6347 RepID=A0A8J1Y8P3_OWEFU|nr:unnamed protein product [Owenia fusiformis]
MNKYIALSRSAIFRVCLNRFQKVKLGNKNIFSKSCATKDLLNGLVPCLGCTTSRSISTDRQSYQNARQEVKAMCTVLERSNLTKPADIARLLGIDSLNLFSKSDPRLQQHRPDGRHDNEDEKKENDGNENGKPPLKGLVFVWLWTAALMYMLSRLVGDDDKSSGFHYVSWTEFVHDMLAKGEVEEIIIGPEMEMAVIKLYPGAVIKGRRLDNTIFHMKIVDSDRFEEKLRQAEEGLGIRREQGIPISYQRGSSWASVAVLMIIALGLYMMFRNVKVQMPNPMDMFAGERKAKYTRVDLQTQKGKGIMFKDVAGLKEAKIEVMEFVDYLNKADKFKELGAKIPKGALLLGPPGCGKTLLAKAVANEAKVPFLAMAGSEFVEIVGGLGAARVRDLFAEARKRSPCIIYVDEIDAIGKQRAGNNWDSSGGEGEHTLNQLLVEMDGMGTQEGVIMLASTNRADVLDKALLRPGRFDRHIMIDLPTVIERQEIFEMYLKQLSLAADVGKYAPRMAELSPGMSGADIANICNEAALHAARDQKKVIDVSDFEYAVERVIAGPAKKNTVLSPEEKRVVAYHEAGHALAGWMLKHTDALLKVSIVPRTSSALGFAQYMPTDNKLYSTEQLFEKMCMALGGRVAESLTFNKVTTGAQDDLQKVTNIAYRQVKQFGMNETVGNIAFPDNGDTFGKKPYSKLLASTIDNEARSLVTKAYRHTEELLQTHKDKLVKIAETLLEKEVLSYEDVQALIGPPPHGAKQTVTAVEWDTGSQNVRAKQDNKMETKT